MKVPLEIKFRNVEKSEEIEQLVREKVDRLDEIFELTSCRVAIEKPQESQQDGNPYRVRIDVTVPPGHELVVRREPLDNEMHTALATVVIDAFKAMRRQLQELRERQRGVVKTHAARGAAVARLFRELGYGFIATPDGREVYFHRNSVLNGDFDRLDVGTEVRFDEELGEMGPQATTVHVARRPGSAQPDAEEPSNDPGAGGEE